MDPICSDRTVSAATGGYGGAGGRRTRSLHRVDVDGPPPRPGRPAPIRPAVAAAAAALAEPCRSARTCRSRLVRCRPTVPRRRRLRVRPCCGRADRLWPPAAAVVTAGQHPGGHGGCQDDCSTQTGHDRPHDSNNCISWLSESACAAEAAAVFADAAATAAAALQQLAVSARVGAGPTDS